MLFLVFLALSAPLVASLDVSTPVPIAVYYESLCPDSIKFITSQLYPVYTSGLKQRISVSLVPFGKAVKNSSPTGTTFECRHGPTECYGDQVQACAIKYLANDEGKLMSLINCLMGTSSKNATYPVDSCGSTTGVNIQEIVTCANGTESITLMEKYADETTGLQPPIKSVPTIIVNGTYSEDNQNLAVSNLRQLVCGHLEGEKPSDCKNAASASAVASFTAILFFVVSRMF